MRSASMRSSTRSTSKTGTGTTVAPTIRLASSPALYPNVWKKGFTTR